MVRAWYMAATEGSRRTGRPRQARQLSVEQLIKATGLEYFKIDADDYENDAILKKLKAERRYQHEDEVQVTEKMPNYKKCLEMWYTEHIHPDDEVRLVLDGTGYFDTRDGEDRMIRVEIVRGDLLCLPAGLYHRFSLDTQSLFRARRYFATSSEWTSINRPCDDHPVRQGFVSKFGLGAKTNKRRIAGNQTPRKRQAVPPKKRR